MVTNDTGTVLWSWNSDAFGTNQQNLDVDGDNVNFPFILRFPGQLFDPESNNHYNYYRDYEPGAGRYLEIDPIGQKGALNTFTYASNNPLYWSDSMGTFNDNSLCGGLPLEIQIDCREHFFPKPTPKDKCEAKCWWASTSTCGLVSFGTGRKAFSTCMAVTGLETAGGSIFACSVIGFAAGIPLSQSCRDNFIKVCEKKNKCCEKSDIK